ncbi:MAG: SAM-dependent chlorinase/fluorinase [Nitrospirota bacterium]
MLAKPIITLTTDFGLKDPFVGLVKGVILSINPEAEIIDITHNISHHNIFEASQVISMSYRYFPPTTIHVVVVDPGVGGDRRPLLVVTEDHYFIGPDNGLFTPVYEELQSNFFKVMHLTASHYFLPMNGSTFHCRDVFAPAAAWLSKGIDVLKFGEEITDYVRIPSIRATIKGGIIKGNVISIDIFGNAITNITTGIMAKLQPDITKIRYRIKYKGAELPLVRYYADPNASENGLSAVMNSFGHLELFAYKENAASKYNINIGDSVEAALI